jgi:hypothetical protein
MIDDKITGQRFLRDFEVIKVPFIFAVMPACF